MQLRISFSGANDGGTVFYCRAPKKFEIYYFTLNSFSVLAVKLGICFKILIANWTRLNSRASGFVVVVLEFNEFPC